MGVLTRFWGEGSGESEASLGGPVNSPQALPLRRASGKIDCSQKEHSRQTVAKLLCSGGSPELLNLR